jgi:hypothetical protein
MTELISVIETRAYLTNAERLLSEEDRSAVIDVIASDPEGGVVIPGTGGLRKLRIALPGRGKRGGARVIYWYHSPGLPVLLLWMLAKSVTADLTKDQYRRLTQAVEGLAGDFGAKR